jgi:diguanylate cyclase (GGDEF)-like protein
VSITEYLGTLPKRALILLGLVLLGLVSAGDYLTHTNYVLEFSPFYLVPISFFSWFIGKYAGLAITATSLGTAYFIRLSQIPYVSAYWNLFILFALYLSSTLMIDQLKRLYDNERTLSRIDPLTRIANRRALFEAAIQAKSLSDRQNVPLSLAYIDIDGFKLLNDHFGHSTGDKVLAVTAAVIQKALRPTDIVARIGGDEFAILLPATDGTTAARVFDRIRLELDRAMSQRSWPVTFSVGIASFSPPLGSVRDMLQTADEVMYTVKRAGKNRLELREVDSSHSPAATSRN